MPVVRATRTFGYSDQQCCFLDCGIVPEKSLIPFELLSLPSLVPRSVYRRKRCISSRWLSRDPFPHTSRPSFGPSAGLYCGLLHIGSTTERLSVACRHWLASSAWRPNHRKCRRKANVNQTLSPLAHRQIEEHRQLHYKGDQTLILLSSWLH